MSGCERQQLLISASCVNCTVTLSKREVAGELGFSSRLLKFFLAQKSDFTSLSGFFTKFVSQARQRR
jgi:hypothetical protein